MKHRILSYKNEKIFEVSFSSTSSEFFRLEEISNLNKNEGMKLCEFIGSFFDFMPGHVRGRHLHQLPHWIWKRKDCFPIDLTFYGGSFHPWHAGHEACIKLFPVPHSLLVLPDNNPWKDKVRNYCLWTYFKDLALNHSATDISFYPGFLGFEEKNPTSKWWPSVNVKQKSLLMGEDTFVEFSKWSDVDRILLTLKKIYVVPRMQNELLYLDAIDFMAKNKSNVQIIRLPNHSHENVSSTLLRDLVS